MRKQPTSGAQKFLWLPLRLVLLMGLLAVGTRHPVVAQTVPVEAVPVPVLPAPATTPTLADTTRQVIGLVPDTSEPTPKVTRRSATRIISVILLVTLTTLLLYNVRSR